MIPPIQSCPRRSLAAACGLLLCPPLFWNQGKALRPTSRNKGDCARPCFGIKAKPWHWQSQLLCDCARPCFGIKAKQESQSRVEVVIVPAPVLESRQSGLARSTPYKELCPPLFWNQGKAQGERLSLWQTLCPPLFWNQGKATVNDNSLSVTLCPPLFWNQGKAPKPG